MRIGLSSANFYPDINTEDSIRIMNSLGFNCGEIFLNSFCEHDESFLELLKEEKNKYGFEVVSVHAFGSMFEPFLFDRYERRRKDVMKFFRGVCKAAKVLGAKSYTFHGMRLIDYKDLDKQLILDVYDELAYTACEEGISLSQENVAWCISSNLNFLSLLRERCKSPISFTLDIKQAYKAGIEPVQYVEIMKGALTNLHLNDRDDCNVCLLPGKGSVDFKKLFELLKVCDYQGDGIIEVYRSNYRKMDELFEAKNYLETTYLAQTIL